MKVSVDPCPRCGFPRCPNCDTQRLNFRGAQGTLSLDLREGIILAEVYILTDLQCYRGRGYRGTKVPIHAPTAAYLDARAETLNVSTYTVPKGLLCKTSRPIESASPSAHVS